LNSVDLFEELANPPTGAAPFQVLTSSAQRFKFLHGLAHLFSGLLFFFGQWPPEGVPQLLSIDCLFDQDFFPSPSVSNQDPPDLCLSSC
jgi:hypothetical protein